jgi:hypothetical protein
MLWFMTSPGTGPYNFDTGPIYQLAGQWAVLGSTFDVQTHAANVAVLDLVAGGAWSGPGALAAERAWLALSNEQFPNVQPACQAISDSLMNYAQAIDQFQQSTNQALHQAEIEGIVAAFVGAVLDILGIAVGVVLGPILTGILEAMGELVTGVLKVLPSAIVNIVTRIGGAFLTIADTSAFRFASSAVTDAAVAIGSNALATLAGDAAAGAPFQMSPQDIAVAAAAGAGLGFASRALEGKAPADDLAAPVIDQNAAATGADVVTDLRSVSVTPELAPGSTPTAALPDDVVPLTAPGAERPEDGLPPAGAADPGPLQSDPVIVPEGAAAAEARVPVATAVRTGLPDDVVPADLAANASAGKASQDVHISELVLPDMSPALRDLPTLLGLGKANLGKKGVSDLLPPDAAPDPVAALVKMLREKAAPFDDQLPAYPQDRLPGYTDKPLPGHDSVGEVQGDLASTAPYRDIGPGFGPDELRKITEDRQRWVENDLAGKVRPATEDPLHDLPPEPAPRDPAAAEREAALTALAKQTHLTELSAEGARPPAMMYRPSTRNGAPNRTASDGRTAGQVIEERGQLLDERSQLAAEPPVGPKTQHAAERITEIDSKLAATPAPARAAIHSELDEVASQRREMLDERSQLAAEPPAGPKTQHAAERITEIGIRLKALDSREELLFREQIRRWGKPATGNLEAGPATNKDAVLAELKKVARTRRDLLSQRGEEAHVDIRLEALNARETDLLHQGRQLEFNHQATELKLLSERLAEVRTQLPEARQRLDTAVAASPSVARRIGIRLDGRLFALDAETSRLRARLGITGEGAAPSKILTRVAVAEPWILRRLDDIAGERAQVIEQKTWLQSVAPGNQAAGQLPNAAERSAVTSAGAELNELQRLQRQLGQAWLRRQFAPAGAPEPTSAAAQVQVSAAEPRLYVAAQLTGLLPVPAELVRPHWAESGAAKSAWEQVLTQHPLPDPGVFELTHVRSGVIVHPLGTTISEPARAEADQLVPDPKMLRILLDPASADGTALAAYIRQLPAPVRSVLTVSAQPAADTSSAVALTGLADQLAIPAAGTAPLRSALKAPGTDPRGDRVTFAGPGPEQIAGGWFFPLLDDVPGVRRAADLLPAFDGYTMAAVHFDQAAGQFAADGQTYAFAGFADRLKSLPEWVPGQPVVLVSCLLGAEVELAGFAARLGSDVLVAVDDVWFTTRGEVVSRPAGGRADTEVVAARDGEWLYQPASGGPPARYRGSLAKVLRQLGAVRIRRPASYQGFHRPPASDVRFSTGAPVGGIPGFGSSLSISAPHVAGASRGRSGASLSTPPASEAGSDNGGSIVSEGTTVVGEMPGAEEWTSVSGRELPPGFGMELGGVRHYPLGHRGQFIRLGGIRLGDDDAIADLVAGALPAGSGVAGPVRALVLGFLRDNGNNAFVLRLLEGGLRFKFKAGRQWQEVRLSLDLGDPSTWVHVREFNPEHEPVGQKRHGAVEADHEVISGIRRVVASDRALDVTGSTDLVLGPAPGGALPFTASVTAGGASATTVTTGSDVVSAAKRFPMVRGRTAYFDFPETALTTRVRLAGSSGPWQVGTLPLRDAGGARAGFPEELAPAKLRDDPPGAFRPVPRTLPDTQKLGINPDEVRTAAQDVDTDDRSKMEAAQRVLERSVEVQKVLTQFLITPEAAAGLRLIRDRVSAQLHLGLAAPDPGLVDGVEDFLSEASFLRMWGDFSAQGATSQLITGEGGRKVRLIVKAGLRQVQASTTDHVPVKEEVQRFTNVVDQHAGSGSASLTPLAFQAGYTIGNPAAPPGGNFKVYAGGSASAMTSDERGQVANTGSGEIRGLVFHGQSVRYLADMHVTVSIAMAGGAIDKMPTVFGAVTVPIRVPVVQRARFEALVTRAASGPTASSTQTAPAQAPSAPAIPVDDEPDLLGAPRHPPASLASGQGAGFSGIAHLHRGEAVLPEILQLIRRAEGQTIWTSPLEALEFAYLRAQLSAKFTRESLTAGAAALFQPGGVRMETSRLAKEGREVITVTVRATRRPDQEPSAQGRIAETTLEVMPSAFAGNSASDSVTSQLTGAIEVGGVAGFDTSTPYRTLGLSLRGIATRTRTSSTYAQASGFGLEAMLYEGPGRYFDYETSFQIEVRIRHETATPRLGSLTRLGYLIAAALTRRPGPSVSQPEITVRSLIEGGSTRFVFPEGILPTTPVNPSVLIETGLVRTVDFPPQPRPRYGRAPLISAVDLPDVRPFLGPGGHLPLTADDQVMEVLGTEQIRIVLERLLRQSGLSEPVIGDLPWTITTPEHLASFMVRGPSVLATTMVGDGLLTDRHAQIRLEGFPTNARPEGGPVEMFQMHVAEGDSTVSSSTARQWTAGFSFSAMWGFFTSLLPGREQDITPSGGFGWQRSRAHLRTNRLTPTSGRLTQGTRSYQQNAADMIWRISVVAYDQNMVYRSPPRPTGAFVTVSRGISFLRLVKPVGDPHAAGPANSTSPGTILRIGTATSGQPLPGVRQVPVMPTTPGSLTTIPAVPLIPVTAASERLFPVDAGSGAPGVTGEGNAVLDAVRQLLDEHAPELLEAYWTREGNYPPVRQVPARLQNVLNLGSLTMLMDLMLGPGLLLTTEDRSLPLAHQRAQILLRAQRDPNSQGYAFLEHVDEVNVSRYAFRLNIDNAAHASTHTYTVAPLAAETSVTASRGPESAPLIDGGDGSAQFDKERAVSEGGYLQTTEATRDTLFIPGPADRYAGDVAVEVSLSVTTQPSRLANAAGGTLPQKIAGLAQHTGDHRRPRPSRTVRLRERVLIPLDLLREDIAPELTPGAAAVEEIAPGTVRPEPTLNITADGILRRQVFNLGFDHEKLRVLFDEVIARLAGNEMPASGQRSAAVRRLTDHGTVARHALHYQLSYQMFTRQLEFMLGQDGFTMPSLFRPGGPFTDTAGEPTVSIRLLSPQLRGKFDGWLESVGYHFHEHNTSEALTNDRSAEAAGDQILTTGDRSQKSPVSPAGQQTSGGIDFSFGTSQTTSSYAVLQSMPRAAAFHRKLPWHRVGADAVITIRLAARNERDLLKLPGGEVTVSFLVRNALELAFAPEALIEFGLRPAGGIPVPSGRYFPHPSDDAHTLAAVFNAPLFTRQPIDRPVEPGDRIDPALRAWFTVAGHYDYQADTFHIGYSYAPGTAFPEGFRRMNNLANDAARFRGGPDLNPIELAAHLWRVWHQERMRVHGLSLEERDVPDLILASSHAGAAGPSGRPPFAQQLAGFLGNRVVATRAHVYQTPRGRTRSVNYWQDTAGQRLAAGAAPATGAGAPATTHQWMVFSGDGPRGSRGHPDLATFIGRLPAGLQPLGASAAAITSGPPPHAIRLGQLWPHPEGSPLDREIMVNGGLAAGPAPGASRVVVIRAATGGDLTEAEQGLTGNLRQFQSPGTHLVVAAHITGTGLPPADLTAALEVVVRALPPDVGPYVLHLDIGDRAAANRLVSDLARRTARIFQAANGTVTATRHGLFASDAIIGWLTWLTYQGRATTTSGALLRDDLPWQVPLETILARPGSVGDDDELFRIPAGLAILPAGTTRAERATLTRTLFEFEPRPERPVLAVYPGATHAASVIAQTMSPVDPVVHYLLPPALRDRPQDAQPDGTWRFGRFWTVEPVRAGLWLRSHQPEAGQRTHVTGLPAGSRYQIIVDWPAFPVAWDTVGAVVNEVLAGVGQPFAVNLPGNLLRGPALETASEIVAALPVGTVSALDAISIDPQTSAPLQQAISLSADALAGYAAGSEVQIAEPELATTNPGSVPTAYNARFVYRLLPVQESMVREAEPLLSGQPGAAILPAGTWFRVIATEQVTENGRPVTVIRLAELTGPGTDHPASDGSTASDEPATPDQPTGLAPGWQWLDESRGLAVPIDPVLTGGRATPFAHWRPARSGPRRNYAVHLITGTIVLDDRTIVPLSYGWVSHGDSLTHYSSGVTLNGQAQVVRNDPAQLTALAGSDQLSAVDLVAWLATHGGLDGPVPGVATAPGWQQVPDVNGGQQWLWGGRGPARGLPHQLTRGRATTQGLTCLTDSLSQLLRPLLPAQQRDQMTLDFLLDWFRDHLPVTDEAYQQIQGGQLVDVWRVLPTFTSMFQVRVQVFQYDAAADGSEQILPSHLDGPPADQDGIPTPVLHLYWRGSHFEPLFAAAPPALALRDPLGAGPPAVAATVAMERQLRQTSNQISQLLAELPPAASARYRQQAESQADLWSSIAVTITPQSPVTATDVLTTTLGHLTTLRHDLEALVAGRADGVPLRTYLPLDSVGNVLNRGALTQADGVLVLTDLDEAMAASLGEVAEVSIPRRAAIDIGAAEPSTGDGSQPVLSRRVVLPLQALPGVFLTGVVYVDAGPLGVQRVIATTDLAPLTADPSPHLERDGRPPRRTPVALDTQVLHRPIVDLHGSVLGLTFISEEEWRADFSPLERYDPSNTTYGQRIDEGDDGGLVDHFPLPWEGPVFFVVAHGFDRSVTLRFPGDRVRSDFGFRLGLAIRQHPQFQDAARRDGSVTVVLFSCETGLHLDGPAQYVADAIGVRHRLFAPTGEVGVLSSGELRVVVTAAHARELPDWREFGGRLADGDRDSDQESDGDEGTTFPASTVGGPTGMPPADFEFQLPGGGSGSAPPAPPAPGSAPVAPPQDPSAPFGASRPTGHRGSRQPGQLTIRIGTGQGALRRRVLAFTGERNLRPGGGMSEQALTDSLTAVLAEATGQAGDGPRDSTWTDLVLAGLAALPPATPDHAYADSLPQNETSPVVAYTSENATPNQGTRYVITRPSGYDAGALAGQPGLIMLSPGARFEVTSVAQQPGGRRITVRHLDASGGSSGPLAPALVPANFESRGESAATSGQVPAGLEMDWAWLARDRGLAVPLTAAAPGGSGRATPLDGWRAAPAGPNREYAIHVDTGAVVLRDRTVLTLTDGWRRRGQDLVHLSGGVILSEAGATIARVDLAAAYDALSQAEQLSREDLLTWLAAHGVLAGPVPGVAIGPGWQQVSDLHTGPQWVWGGPGPALELPPGLIRGRSAAQGMRCLTDSLAQLLAPLLPRPQRDQMSLEYLLEWFKSHLSVSNEAYQQILAGQMVDVWSVLNTFTAGFQVRVQVFQHGEPTAGVRGILPAQLQGPATDRDGNPTPVLHLYWRGDHFEPLLTAPSSYRLAEEPDSLRDNQERR